MQNANKMVGTVDGPADQYRLLAEEADHRPLNNLQSIVSLLSLQAQRSSSPDARCQLRSASQRVVSLQRIHRALRSFEPTHPVELKTFMSSLCTDYEAAFGSEKEDGFAVTVDGAEVVLPARDAAAVATAANELLMNAIKYGSGAIYVVLSKVDSTCFLTIHNEGAPLPQDFTSASSSGLGMGIVNAFARRLHGELSIDSGTASSGPSFVLAFPLASAPSS